jgi:hypothetical protein
MMTETLRIDTGLVLEAGGRLQSIAAAIPPPPASFTATGADALSTAIAAKVAEVVDPVIAQLPLTKEDLARYAQNVVAAANKYDAADRQIAEEILKRLQEFDAAKTGGSGSTGGGGASTVGGGSAAAGAVVPGAGGAATGAGGGVTSAASPAAGAGTQAGQMMQMPMQMAQQAAQVPTQMASAAGSLPGTLMQGVQGAAQQAVQAAEKAGEKSPQDVDAQSSDQAAHDERGEAPSEQAAAGSSGGERVPEPPPSSTRTADSPEIAL